MPRQMRAVLGMRGHQGGNMEKSIFRAKQDRIGQLIANKQRAEDIARTKAQQDRAYGLEQKNLALQKKAMKQKKKADKWGMYLQGASTIGNLYSAFTGGGGGGSSFNPIKSVGNLISKLF